jgi:hypothetical protein
VAYGPNCYTPSYTSISETQIWAFFETQLTVSTPTTYEIRQFYDYANAVGLGSSSRPSAFDDILTEVYITRRGDLSWGQAADLRGGNLIKNFPNYIPNSATTPPWWDEGSAAITLRTSDNTTEALTGGVYEEVMKAVSTAGGEYVAQRWTHADEPWLFDGGEMSVGAWVYSATAGTLSLQLYDVGGAAVLDQATTTLTGGWVFLQLEGVTVGTTATELRFSHSAAATFYVTLPAANIGPKLKPWEARDHQDDQWDDEYWAVNAATGDATWHTVDVSAYVSPTAFGVWFTIECTEPNYVGYRTPGTNLDRWDTRSNGLVAGQFVLLDGDQCFEYQGISGATGINIRVYGERRWV